MGGAGKAEGKAPVLCWGFSVFRGRDVTRFPPSGLLLIARGVYKTRSYLFWILSYFSILSVEIRHERFTAFSTNLASVSALLEPPFTHRFPCPGWCDQCLST